MKKKTIKPITGRIIKSGMVSFPAAPHKRAWKDEKLIIFEDWCKKCGLCVAICPHQALKQNEEGYPELIDQDKCKLCSRCWRICPDFVIERNIEFEDDSNGSDE